MFNNIKSQRLPADSALIMVAVMPALRDMEIARLFGWYRIPLRSAPKVISVDYIAFYQTGAFLEKKWIIEYFAPVVGHELTTRKELLHDESDHPHAHEAYYKIQLGQLVRLPLPISAGKWKRITFFYTTGRYLNNARKVKDLIVRREERTLLWRALRERALEEQEYNTEGILQMQNDDHSIDELLGLLKTFTEGSGDNESYEI